MLGQAKRLFELNSLLNEPKLKNDGAKIISVSSGKGGTGKSFVSTNIAVALAETGNKVLLIDLDLKFANLSTMLNVNPKQNIYHYLTYSKSLSDVITSYSKNLSLILGESGKIDYPTFNFEKSKLFLNELKNISIQYDFIIVDTASGIDSGSLNILINSDEIILVTTPEPTAVMDGYVILKMLINNGANNSINVIINKCFDGNEAIKTFESLEQAVKHFLKKEISYLGKINFSQKVIQSIQDQLPFKQASKNSKIINQIEKITSKFKKQTNG